MSPPDSLTHTQEDYLRAIYVLYEKSGGGVKSIDIAKYLNLNRSSVSELLLELQNRTLISHQRYGGVQLTRSGKSHAKRLVFKHRLIEVFLHQTLGRPISKIHEEAHRLEHAFSDESIRALFVYLGKPRLDPHGKPLK